MSEMTQLSGYIHIVTGPMFCGKTSELIRLLRRYQVKGKKILVFKHALDDQRYGEGQLFSHDLQGIDCFSIRTIKDVKKYFQVAGSDVEMIGFDEVEFYAIKNGREDPVLVKEWFDFFHSLADSGKKVILAGLNMNFRGEPFALMAKLLTEKPDMVTFLNAVCAVCHSELASRTQRLLSNGSPAPYNDPLVKVGGLDFYQARCRFCHECRREVEKG